MHIFVHIIAWNEEHSLPAFFDSVDNQTSKNFTLRILNNGSTDGTSDYLRRYRSQTLVARTNQYTGFCAGHNQLFQFTQHHLNNVDPKDIGILVIGADLIWDEDFISHCIQGLEQSPQTIGSFSPKIYQAFGSEEKDEVLRETVQSDILESTGILPHRAWRYSLRGKSQIDQGQFDQEKHIFGPSRLAALYRYSALQEIVYEYGEIFDGNFFAEGEDIDIAYRLQSMGYESRFLPEAKVFHIGGRYGYKSSKLFARTKDSSMKSAFFAALSLRNHCLFLLKHLSWRTVIYDFPWLIFRDLPNYFWKFLWDKESRIRFIEIFRQRKAILKKRKSDFAKAQISDKELRRFMD